jgi:membrane protease YdiL (CAAX protease family)
MIIQKVINFQIQKIKSNPVTFIFVLLLAAISIYIGYIHESLKQSIAYLIVLGISAFLIDFFTLNRTFKDQFIVKNPRKESIIFLLTVLLGTIFLIIRFSGVCQWEHMSGLARIAVIPLILFVFPIGLAIILLAMKYKPIQLGIQLQGFAGVIPILILFAATNYIIAPERLTWNLVLEEEGGIVPMLFSGFIVAGLSEEFFRVIGQTRLGSYFKNFGAGWLITSTLWALMHAPKWYGEDHDITEAILGSIRIIPLGLMWGYFTHRTKSILPSVILHGLNFWGLQNF